MDASKPPIHIELPIESVAVPDMLMMACVPVDPNAKRITGDGVPLSEIEHPTLDVAVAQFVFEDPGSTVSR
jgi:hypothetical protein